MMHLTRPGACGLQHASGREGGRGGARDAGREEFEPLILVPARALPLGRGGSGGVSYRFWV